MRRTKRKRSIKNPFIKDLFNSIYRYREGIIIGAAIGWLAAFIAIKQGINNLPELASAGKAVLDSLFARETVLQTVNAKFYSVMMILGAMSGAVIDHFVQVVMRKPPRRKIKRGLFRR